MQELDAFIGAGVIVAFVALGFIISNDVKVKLKAERKAEEIKEKKKQADAEKARQQEIAKENARKEKEAKEKQEKEERARIAEEQRKKREREQAEKARLDAEKRRLQEIENQKDKEAKEEQESVSGVLDACLKRKWSIDSVFSINANSKVELDIFATNFQQQSSDMSGYKGANFLVCAHRAHASSFKIRTPRLLNSELKGYKVAYKVDIQPLDNNCDCYPRLLNPDDNFAKTDPLLAIRFKDDAYKIKSAERRYVKVGFKVKLTIECELKKSRKAQTLVQSKDSHAIVLNGIMDQI